MERETVLTRVAVADYQAEQARAQQAEDARLARENEQAVQRVIEWATKILTPHMAPNQPLEFAPDEKTGTVTVGEVKLGWDEQRNTPLLYGKCPDCGEETVMHFYDYNGLGAALENFRPEYDHREISEVHSDWQRRMDIARKAALAAEHVPTAFERRSEELEQLVTDSAELERELMRAALDLGKFQGELTQASQRVKDAERAVEEAEAVIQLEVELAAAGGKSNAEQRKALLTKKLAELRVVVGSEYNVLCEEQSRAEDVLVAAKTAVAQQEFEFTALRAKTTLRAAELAALTELVRVSDGRRVDDEI